MYQALIEARIPFEMVHDKLLDAEHVDRFKTLILPNIAALSDTQCEQIRDFVGRGGSIVATLETSLYDEWGVRRDDFGLAELFGVKLAGRVEGPTRNSYLRVESQPDTRDVHSLLTGLDDAQRLIHGIFRVPVNAVEKFPNPPLTLVPSYPDLPMEEVYPRNPRTDVPEVYLREVGAGRVVYFPWDIDRTFWEELNVDHGLLLRNAVEWATNEPPPVKVTGLGVLDVTAWRQKDSMTVHLVNLTNPMMMKGPFRELIPAGEQTVRIRLPEAKNIARIHLLSGQQPLRIERTEREVSLSIPSILIHEIVAVDFH
jgi:hypothetical protein